MPGITLSNPASPPRSESPQRTNTLIVTQLPLEFFHPTVLDTLKDHFALYGPLHTWAPLRAFARAILVYYSYDDAELVKQQCDGLTIEATQHSPRTVLRVFRADPTPVSPREPTAGPDPHYLCPPAIEKNFLISPPGSPPVGWEPVKEEPPNATPLADDLIAALKQLQVLDRRDAAVGPEVLLEPGEAAGIAVFVEDCDAEDSKDGAEEDWEYGQPSPARLAWRPMVTQRPPMAVSA